MFYLIHGNNSLEQEEALANLLAKHEEQDLAGINKDVLEFPFTFEQLRNTCDTIPFLGDKRIVVAKNAIARGNEQLAKKLKAYLPDLPATTLLIFVEYRQLPSRHPVYVLTQKGEGKALTFQAPKARALPAWVRARAKKHGGAIEPAAAARLAQNIGANLHQLDQEITKLLLYRGDAGTITLKDVKVMVPYVESIDVIFDMVDALGQRRPQTAARLLHRVLEPKDKNALSIFGMIVRQYRLLIQTRWLMDQGKTEPEIIKRLSLHPYVAKKMCDQAGYFTIKQLRQAYHLLMRTDLAIKRGEIAQGAALDLLVAQLTGI